MQKQFRWVCLPALALAIGLLWGGGTALYAADEETSPTAGLVIVAVDAQGPAAAAGVVRGDILLTLDGAAVNSIGALEAELVEMEAGVAIPVQVQHGDEVLTYEITTGDRNGRAYLGLLPYAPDRLLAMPAVPQLRWLDRSDAVPLADVMTTQVVVTDVMTDSVAAEAGLQANDVIIAIDGETVNRPRVLRTHLAALEPGDEIVLTVMRGADEPLEISITLREGENGPAKLGVQLGVIVTATRVNGEEGALLAMPAQPGFAAPFDFAPEGFSRGLRRFFRFFDLPIPFQNFSMPHPGMMAAPDMLQHRRFILPESVPSVEARMIPPAVFEFNAEASQDAQRVDDPAAYY